MGGNRTESLEWPGGRPASGLAACLPRSISLRRASCWRNLPGCRNGRRNLLFRALALAASGPHDCALAPSMSWLWVKTLAASASFSASAETSPALMGWGFHLAHRLIQSASAKLSNRLLPSSRHRAAV